MRGRNEQIVRVLQLLGDLTRRDGWDLYELADRYETSTRTIRRDLDALANAGIPLKRVAGEGSRLRWCLDLESPKARELAQLAIVRVQRQ
ncbi:MAG: DeoR family transcriptional regulator [Myxococcaceae bacterium]